MFELFGIYYNKFKPGQVLLGGTGMTSTFDIN